MLGHPCADLGDLLKLCLSLGIGFLFRHLRGQLGISFCQSVDCLEGVDDTLIISELVYALGVEEPELGLQLLGLVYKSQRSVLKDLFVVDAKKHQGRSEAQSALCVTAAYASALALCLPGRKNEAFLKELNYVLVGLLVVDVSLHAHLGGRVVLLVEFLQIPLVLFGHQVSVLHQRVDLVLAPDAVVGVYLQTHGLGSAYAYDKLVVCDRDGHPLGPGLEYLAALDYGCVVLILLYYVGVDPVLFYADRIVVHKVTGSHPFDSFELHVCSFQVT